jgi:hypothetical protein
MTNLRRASLVSCALALLAAGCGVEGGSSSSAGSAGSTGSVGSTGDSPPFGSTSSGGSTGTADGTSTAPGSTPTGTAGTIGAAGSTGSAGATGSAGSTGFAGAGGSTGAVMMMPSPGAPAPTPTAGKLTAGTWDDNLNFDFYEKYLADMAASQVAGLPTIERRNRLVVTVVDGAGAPLAGARVTVSEAGKRLFESTTRGDGKLFVFPGTIGAQLGDPFTIAVAAGSASASAAAHVGDAKVDVAVVGAHAAPAASLDLALVVDTTGSMGDELAYLTVEMNDIVARVSQQFPNVSQRWAAIFYRDVGDEYVVRSFDFTASLPELTSHIAAQSAGGGGDFPEAPEQGLAKLTTLSWRPDATARMAFWIADAPHHDAQARAMSDDVLALHTMGVRLYPVSASGADELVEYTMRTAAEVTGGRYLFITSDSGIGGAHKEPTIPCYTVTTLSKAMQRMIDMELLGTDAQPAPADVIRTTGNPQDGRCPLSNGQFVTIL